MNKEYYKHIANMSQDRFSIEVYKHELIQRDLIKRCDKVYAEFVAAGKNPSQEMIQEATVISEANKEHQSYIEAIRKSMLERSSKFVQ